MNDFKSANEIIKTFSEMTPEERVKAARGNDRYTAEQIKEAKDEGGIIVPNATQIPNEILDQWLHLLTESEIKVLLYIIRKTFGYNKITGDKIPLSQIMNGTVRKDGSKVDNGTGLSKSSCLSALSALELMGLIRVVRSRTDSGTRKVNYYTLVIRSDYNKV